MTKNASPARQTLMELMFFNSLFAYLYCMMASSALVNLPVLGGALYLLGRVAGVYARYARAAGRALPKALKRAGDILLAVAFVLALAMTVIYPSTLEIPYFWLLVGLVFLLTARGVIAQGAAQREKHKLEHLILTELIFCALAAALLLLSLEGETGWYLLGGFALSCGLECYGVLTRAPEKTPPDLPPRPAASDELSGVRAYRIFQYMLLSIAAALQLTLIIAYTFIGYSAQDVLLCMGIAISCTLLTREVSTLLLKRALRRDSDPGNMLVFGLALWMYGLIVFARDAMLPGAFSAYLSLSACSCGATVCATVLMRLDDDMRNVAVFATGHPLSESYEFVQYARIEYASVLGQTAALVGLSLMCYLSAGYTENLMESFRPLLIVPALILVGAALLVSLKFPLTKEHLKKLRRFLSLTEKGESNPPLEAQLKEAVVGKSHRHYGVKIIMAILRPFYYHKIRGRENVRLDDDVSAVFVCNHGELYGPIVTNLYVPYSFRPWVISEMMEPKEVADYIYTFTILRQRWLPERWKRPLAEFLTPIIIWVMHSIESIPVYRDRPHELMKTFRLSAQAMQAGDNILLFPENPHSDKQDKPGYLRDGVGEFSSGFTMLAVTYYQKTGKRAQFIPIYASKRARTLTFGVPVRYDPDRLPVPEKERIVSHLRGEMLRMAEKDLDNKD